MKRAKKLKHIHPTLNVWFDKRDEAILIACNDPPWRSGVSNNPSAPSYHPRLYKRLLKMLEEANGGTL
jgi:hypothetical protein